MSDWTTVAGVRLEVVERGHGRRFSGYTVRRGSTRTRPC
jgi:hypothetical protein